MAIFQHVIVLLGDRNIFLASAQPISDDPELWSHRLEERGGDTRDVTPLYLLFLLATERYPKLQATLAATSGRINVDFAPVCHYYDAALWMSRFASRVAAALFPPEGVQL
ncbi:MAG TPA: hypothetical protein DCM67_04375 [Propionibacteriaceae bacterium]|nr:hypothetical protein [Propionibacteriaceae bacterium]